MTYNNHKILKNAERNEQKPVVIIALSTVNDYLTDERVDAILQERLRQIDQRSAIKES